MTLGEFILNYRSSHNMSIRAFASLSGISPQQISNIERGIGNDGKPMTSTMKTYKKIAEAVGMSEHDLLTLLSDNVCVNPSSPSVASSFWPVLTQPEEDLIRDYRDASEEIREEAAGMLHRSADRNRKDGHSNALSAG